MSENSMKRPVIFLRGRSVYLRPLEIGDLPHLQRWINEPQTRRNLMVVKPFNEIVERKWIETQSENQHGAAFGIVLQRRHQLIGSCGLFLIDWVRRHANFGISIGEAALRGKGYGAEATRLTTTYAFQTLNLNRVELQVYAFNAAGIRCYEKVGYVREGIQRERAFVDGAYVDVHMYSALAREWNDTGSEAPPRPARQR